MWLNQFDQFEYIDTVDADPLTIKIRPYAYREITKASLQTLEQQKLVQIATDDNMSDEEKIEKFQAGFIKLTKLTVDLVAGCITRIETPEGSVTDQQFINEFLNNAPKDVFEKIHDHVLKIKNEIDLKPQSVKCGHCEHEFTTPITMDQSNFFAVRS
jgi:predicted transcriptional regulator